MEHVLRRDGRYSWRARVPADIARITRRQQVFCTLGTADPRIARDEAARLSVQALDVWAEVRSRMSGQTAEEVRELVESLVFALRASHGRRGRGRTTMPDFQDEFDEAGPIRQAESKLPELMQRISEAEADSGRNGRVGALAGNMQPRVFGAFKELMGLLDPRFLPIPTPPVLDYMSKTYIKSRKLNAEANRHIEGLT